MEGTGAGSLGWKERSVAQLCVHGSASAGVDVPRVARHSRLDRIAFKDLSAHLSRPQDRLSAMVFLPELQRYSRYFDGHWKWIFLSLGELWGPSMEPTPESWVPWEMVSSVWLCSEAWWDVTCPSAHWPSVCLGPGGSRCRVYPHSGAGSSDGHMHRLTGRKVGVCSDCIIRS